MSKTGTFLQVPSDQEGAEPKLVTKDERLPTGDHATDVARGIIEGSRPFVSYGEREVQAGEVNRYLLYPTLMAFK